MQVLHTGGQEQELDVLEAGEGKGVNDLVDVDVDFFIFGTNCTFMGLSLITSMEMCSDPANA